MARSDTFLLHGLGAARFLLQKRLCERVRAYRDTELTDDGTRLTERFEHGATVNHKTINQLGERDGASDFSEL